MIVLDEINNAVDLPAAIGEVVIPPDELVELIRNKPTELHLVLTGRNAHPKVIEVADLVSEVKCIKHHYQSGVVAKEGIEI